MTRLPRSRFVVTLFICLAVVLSGIQLTGLVVSQTNETSIALGTDPGVNGETHSTEGEPNETINVTVWANATDVAGYQANISFDPDNVRVVSVTGSGDFADPIKNIDNEAGQVRFNQVRSTGTDDPLLATLTIELNGSTNSNTSMMFIKNSTKLSTSNTSLIELDTYEPTEISIESTNTTTPTETKTETQAETATDTQTETETGTETRTATETQTQTQTETETETQTSTPTPERDDRDDDRDRSSGNDGGGRDAGTRNSGDDSDSDTSRHSADGSDASGTSEGSQDAPNQTNNSTFIEVVTKESKAVVEVNNPEAESTVNTEFNDSDFRDINLTSLEIQITSDTEPFTIEIEESRRAPANVSTPPSEANYTYYIVSEQGASSDDVYNVLWNYTVNETLLDQGPNGTEMSVYQYNDSSWSQVSISRADKNLSSISPAGPAVAVGTETLSEAVTTTVPPTNTQMDTQTTTAAAVDTTTASDASSTDTGEESAGADTTNFPFPHITAVLLTAIILIRILKAE